MQHLGTRCRHLAEWHFVQHPVAENARAFFPRSACCVLTEDAAEGKLDLAIAGERTMEPGIDNQVQRAAQLREEVIDAAGDIGVAVRGPAAPKATLPIALPAGCARQA